MTTDRTPLLVARDDASDVSEPPSGRPDRRPWSTSVRETFLFTWALLATAAVIVLAVFVQHRNSTTSGSVSLPLESYTAAASVAGGETTSRKKKKNLVFMVSDGMGPASLSMTRSFRQFVNDLPIDDTLVLDQHFWGTSRTRSSSSLVTDSAAGATAFSCGKKSYNGAISMLPDYSPCGTVLEAAKRAGYMTGLVVTTDVSDATPACFASHVFLRQQMDEIAMQEIGEGPLGRTVDLILGGGRCHFLPNSSTTQFSCRGDDFDLTSLAQEKHGWSYTDSRAGFDAMQGGKNVSLPALGLFADKDIPFEIDRRNMADVFPSLSEMAATALEALSHATKDSDKGFFLMIEGSRIDHAGHINDPAAQVREVLEYDKTFKSVLDFLDQDDTAEGALVATSDHETGGLSIAYQSKSGELPVYKWYPERLALADASAERLSAALIAHILENPTEGSDARLQWIDDELVRKHLAITDAHETELNALATNPTAATVLFARMISARARIGWSTHGHSAVDVNIYSSGGPGTEKLRGNVENTDVGKFLSEYLGVDTKKITKELRTKMGKPSEEDVQKVKAMEMVAPDMGVMDTGRGEQEEEPLFAEMGAWEVGRNEDEI